MGLRHSLILSLITLVFVTACNPPQNRGNRTTVGRLGRGYVGMTGGNYGGSGTAWGQVNPMTDWNSFNYALQALTAPMLNSTPDQSLGYVGGQGTGVMFWGQVRMLGGSYYAGGGNGQADQSGTIHIEIYDDRVGQPDSNGNPLPPTVLEIGPGVPGFGGVQGSISGGRVNLYFASDYQTIQMVGQISGPNFTGQMSFGGGQPLGQFTVPANGFFQ